MTESEQYQLERTTRPQTATTSDHVYETILRENIPATSDQVYDTILKENIPSTREFSHENTLTEIKDVPHMRILTDLTTSIRRIKVVCLVLMIMVIVMATSIGVLLSELKKGEGATEGNVDVLQARVEHIKSETELKIVEDTSTMDKQSTRLTRLESDIQDLLAAHDEYNNTISQLELDRTNYLASIQSHNTRLMDLESNMTNGIASIQSLNTRITDIDEVSGYASAFTAWYPSSTTVTEPIKFRNVISNIGSDYSLSSGNFTCRFPGIYMFILNLYKYPLTSYTYVTCYIRKNGVNTVRAYNNPASSADGGYYGTSNSVVLHLNHSDVVTVGGCNGHILSYSSFTGFLVKAD